MHLSSRQRRQKRTAGLPTTVWQAEMRALSDADRQRLRVLGRWYDDINLALPGGDERILMRLTKEATAAMSAIDAGGSEMAPRVARAEESLTEYEQRLTIRAKCRLGLGGPQPATASLAPRMLI